MKVLFKHLESLLTLKANLNSLELINKTASNENFATRMYDVFKSIQEYLDTYNDFKEETPKILEILEVTSLDLNNFLLRLKKINPKNIVPDSLGQNEKVVDDIFKEIALKLKDQEFLINFKRVKRLLIKKEMDAIINIVNEQLKGIKTVLDKDNGVNRAHLKLYLKEFENFINNPEESTVVGLRSLNTQQIMGLTNLLKPLKKILSDGKLPSDKQEKFLADFKKDFGLKLKPLKENIKNLSIRVNLLMEYLDKKDKMTVEGEPPLKSSLTDDHRIVLKILKTQLEGLKKELKKEAINKPFAPILKIASYKIISLFL